ncbi:phage antirepressor KilAC domain-containing protein [Orbus sturtevantii]|uniref:phage antirepressor KilAC domain-containing protein n=1 Tax=Orbus sturtevantii TaxID=3074109 RepID=UPI00370D97C0
MSNLTNMNKLSNDELTMSSREIAELVESRHDSVKRTIERLIDKGVIQLTPLVEVTNHLGQTVLEYRLIKRDSYIVVAQLCPEFTARLVDRWQELENNLVPKTLPEALRLAAQAIEENIQLNEKIALDAPKVSFVDNFVDVGTTKSLRETAKILKMSERAMIDCLEDDRILFRQSGNLLPYANHINNGNFEVKTGERNGHAYTQTRVSTKGMAYIARRYASELMVG